MPGLAGWPDCAAGELAECSVIEWAGMSGTLESLEQDWSGRCEHHEPKHLRSSFSGFILLLAHSVHSEKAIVEWSNIHKHVTRSRIARVRSVLEYP